MRSSLLARRRAALVAAREIALRPSGLDSSAPPAFLVATSTAPGVPSISRPPRHSHRPLMSSLPSIRSISSSTRHPSPSSAAATVPTPEPEPEPAQASASTSSSQAQQPPTHYTFFPLTLPQGPPPAGPFAINIRSLKKEFLTLQSRAHPDLAAHADKSSAQALSARINEAYKVLSSPLLRAQYLLHLRGEDVGLGEEGKTDDPELLMEVLETHHAIEDAETEGELEGIRAENEVRIMESEDRLERLFKADQLGEAREEAVRLKYWVAVREKIHEWEVEKGKGRG